MYFLVVIIAIDYNSVAVKLNRSGGSKLEVDRTCEKNLVLKVQGRRIISPH